ncbi:MAG: cyclic nucleotide-binding domain-containing protein [Acidimicrobiales bacterium]
MLIIERVVTLRTAPVFSELPEHVLAQVAAIVEEVTAEVGQVVIEEGLDESWMFVLVDGTASVLVSDVVVAELGPGATIGELAALDPQPRSATVKAAEPCLLFRIDHAALREVMVDQPDLMLGLITMLVRRLRDTNITLTERL